MMELVAVCIGGGLGAILRYIFGVLLGSLQNKAPFPFAMIAANWVGSAGLGFTVVHFPQRGEEVLYLAITVGFFGALTTFSTFSNEAMQLLKKPSYVAFVSYLLFTLVGSGFFFWLGAFL